MILMIISACLIGACLGLLGAGGSILTLPSLVFLLQRPEKIAIAESLAIVCLMALVGALPYGMRGQIHWRSVLLFGLPGIFGAYLGACCSSYLSGTVQLILFACVLLTVAWLMLVGYTPLKTNPRDDSFFKIGMQGFFIGCLTGLMGIGGGFFIVPALLFFVHLDMSFAIGTSLLIIALNSGTGFIKHVFLLNALNMHVDGKIIALYSILGIFGTIFGSLIGKNISQIRLRKTFGVGMIIMGLYILVSYVGQE